MQRLLIAILGCCALHAWIFPAAAGDLDRERRWAEEIEDAILVGDPEWLDADGHRFLSLFAEAESAAG